MAFQVGEGSLFNVLGVPSREEATRQQAFNQKRQAAKLSAAQLQLERLPIGDPRRDELEVFVAQQFGGDQVAADIATGFRPAAPKREFKAVPRTSRLVEPTPIGGGPPKVILPAEAPGPGTTVNVSTAKQFGGAALEEGMSEIIDAGLFASRRLPRFKQMFDLMSDPSVQTGSLQTAITSLQGIADDLGIDLEATAKKVGINMGSLSKKQDFNRVSRQVLIDSFKDFKGNLNTAEVIIAKENVARMGLSEDANIEAVAASMAAAQLAQARGKSGVRAFGDVKAGQSLMEALLSDDASEFIALKDKIAQQMRTARQSEQLRPQGRGVLRQEGNRQLLGTTQDGKRIFQSGDRFFIEE